LLPTEIEGEIMREQHTVLLVGGTGRTGGRVLRELLDRGVRVRAIVRSASRLPPGIANHPDLAAVEADLLSLGDADLQSHLRGADVIVSCLGHSISLKGIFGPPRDLVTRATTRLCRAVEALPPAAPIKFVLMSSVSVNRPSGLDTRRSLFERALLWLVRCLVPPAKDNQRAADFLLERVGPDHAFIQWVAVRPDSLVEGGVSNYALHEGITDGLFSPGSTSMANVAHFMGELATNAETWTAWKFKLPVITNVRSKPA
jgi:NAD(P)-dependent dehydrogenase (short-subunit alcohol dehydrogenase family)